MASAAFMSPPLERTFSSMDAPNGTAVQNVMNQKAGLFSSLYQTSQKLRKRLETVPGLEGYLHEMDMEEEASAEETDIVTAMWNMLRRGYPLMELYNAMRPRKRLVLDQGSVAESKQGKAATFKFLSACMGELGIPAADCFLITDLYGKDTTGFVKVLKLVDKVLDILRDRGFLRASHDQQVVNDGTSSSHPKYQQNVINEIVTTERDYVSHLDTLQQFKDELERSGVVSGDVIHDIFLNLNQLVDYQRRFLIRVEQQNCLDASMQNWGRLFGQYAEGFKIYEPFIANASKANSVSLREFHKIRMPVFSLNVQGMALDSNALTGYLLKPLQRITKYPLLLSELIKYDGLDVEKMRDVIDGREAINKVVAICNKAAERSHRADEVSDLMQSVDDWKGHRLDHFGDLILSGQHTVLKGDAIKNEEREYKIYLFERILLCCKDVNQSKAKNRMPSRNSNKTGKPRLQLKGRIFMQNVTDILKNEEAKSSTGKPYLLKVIWKGDPAIESFNVCFQTAEIRDKWWSLATEQRDKLPKVRDPTSATEFKSLSGAKLENPYYEQQDDIDDDEELPRLSNGSTLVSSQADYPSSRNASNTSLRSRSATGGSDPRLISAPPNMAPPSARPARFPLPEPGYPPTLKVATSFSPPTPDERAAASYFSPVGDSPSSSIRSSTQSGTMTPLPFRGQPPPNITGRSYDNSKHNTAPPGTYHQERHAQRPPMAIASHSANHLPLQQSRSRSLSSSDIHQHSHSPNKRHMNGTMHPVPDEPPVPQIPQHMKPFRGPINRSQTNSPTDAQRYGRSQTPANAYGQPPIYANYEGHSRSNSRQGHLHAGPGPTPQGISQRLVSPSLPSATIPSDGLGSMSQVKMKVYYEFYDNHATYATIVVPFNIRYQSLVDRVDSKIEKVAQGRSIGKGAAKLKYKDDDDTFVSVLCDEDVRNALDDWREKYPDGSTDWELYLHEVKAVKPSKAT